MITEVINSKEVDDEPIFFSACLTGVTRSDVTQAKMLVYGGIKH